MLERLNGKSQIHNDVAQAFLVRFLQVLAESKDVHDALKAACQYLKLEKHLTYPSAYLIPSLFCHPDAVLFRIEPFGLKQYLKQWLPTRWEASALGAFLLLSVLTPVQNYLLETRVFIQALYRDITSQVPPPVPPVLLVHIDWDSLVRADISNPNPMDRSYLGNLIDKLSALDAKVVGVDYVLDLPRPKDGKLAQAVHTAVEHKGTWFVFAAELRDASNKEVGVAPETGIANRNWSLQGYINAWPQYVELLPVQTDCYHTCPFAYLLAMVRALNQEPSTSDLPQPRLQNRTDFRTQVFHYINRGNKQDDTITFLQQARLHPIASFSETFGQMWLRPINDFSIPPNSVYNRVTARELLDRASDTTAHYKLNQQVALIAPGGYEEAGVTKPGEDNFSVPLAVAYWRGALGYTAYPSIFTGAEAHAYTIHHLLTRRLVLPIPDLWMILVAVMLGKGTTLVLIKNCRQHQWWAIGLAGATAAYGLAGLQTYISVGVLLPWLLPSAAFWIYVLPALRRKFYE